jgi:hypothetical protein
MPVNKKPVNFSPLPRPKKEGRKKQKNEDSPEPTKVENAAEEEPKETIADRVGEGNQPKDPPTASTPSPAPVVTQGTVSDLGPVSDKRLIAGNLQFRPAEADTYDLLRRRLNMQLPEILEDLGELKNNIQDVTSTTFHRILMLTLLFKVSGKRSVAHFLETRRDSEAYAKMLEQYITPLLQPDSKELKAALCINALHFEGRRNYTEADLEQIKASQK